MKIGRISKPVVISTSHQPISALLSVTQVGASPLTQSVNQTENEWEPDRTISPLTLSPMLTAVDTESGQSVTLNPTFMWYHVTYKLGRDGGTEILTLITQAYDSTPHDYAIDNNGNLIVRKNVSPNSPVTLLLRASYTDPHSGRPITKDEYVLLTSVNKPNDKYTVEILTENVVKYNPLDGDFLADDPKDAGSEFNFTAVVRKNGEICTDEVYIEWWASSALYPDTMLMISDEEAMIGYEYTRDHPGYMVGQGGSTLKWDARYDKKTKIQAYVFHSADSDENPLCTAVRTIIWDIPKVKGDILPLNGRAIRYGDKNKKFRLMLRTRTNDIDSSKAGDMFQTVWKREDTNGQNKATIGYGQEVEVTADSLRRFGNNGVLIMPEVTMRGQLEQIVIDGVDVVLYSPSGDSVEYDGRGVYKSRYTQ